MGKPSSRGLDRASPVPELEEDRSDRSDGFRTRESSDDETSEQEKDALPEEQNLWGQTYERAMSDVLVMYGEMASAIAENIHVKLTSQEETRLADSRQVNPDAAAGQVQVTSPRQPPGYRLHTAPGTWPTSIRARSGS